MKIDRVHFYVQDAVKTKDWFVNNLGFQAIYSHHNSHTQTEAIAYNSVKFLISSPLNSFSPVSNYLDSHPSGIVDIAFQTENINSIITRAERLGVAVLEYPETNHKQAKIAGWGALQHTLIEGNEAGKFYSNDSHIVAIDHVVLNVPQGQLTAAVNFYRALFDFKVQQTFNIQTAHSGLYSRALIDSSGQVQFNINEPSSPTSQIQQFLNLNNGAGIQHLALRSLDLINAVARMRQKQVNFLNIPKTYYHHSTKPTNISQSKWSAIATQQILIDSDASHSPSGKSEEERGNAHQLSDRSVESLLMQIFTQPIFEQPTFFLEFIERIGNARGFGQGNFQALFEAVEREILRNEEGQDFL
jgi:4-hydroxyphenylpyruvate dioxygenase